MSRGDVREFRPSLDTHRRTLRSPSRLAGLLLFPAYVAWLGSTGEPALLVLVLLALAVTALPLGAWLATARVRVTGRGVSMRGGTGRSRTVPLTDVAAVLLLPGFHERGDPPTGLLVLLDAGRCCGSTGCGGARRRSVRSRWPYRRR